MSHLNLISTRLVDLKILYLKSFSYKFDWMLFSMTHTTADMSVLCDLGV